MAEALLAQLALLLEACPHHQPLACMKAKQVSHCLTCASLKLYSNTCTWTEENTVSPVVTSCCTCEHHQAVCCRWLLSLESYLVYCLSQELYMGRFGDALATLDPFLGGKGMQPSRWAVHLYVHVHWLTADLYQVLLYTPKPTAAC